MWRSFFLAIGITLVIVGVECLAIERATLTDRAVQANNVSNPPQPFGGVRRKDVVPPDWAPWSLMTSGAVVILYSFSIPRRVAS